MNKSSMIKTGLVSIMLVFGMTSLTAYAASHAKTEEMMKMEMEKMEHMKMEEMKKMEHMKMEEAKKMEHMKMEEMKKMEMEKMKKMEAPATSS